jgi:hypothetical protein
MKQPRFPCFLFFRFHSEAQSSNINPRDPWKTLAWQRTRGLQLFIHPLQIFLNQVWYGKLIGTTILAHLTSGAASGFIDGFPVPAFLQNPFPHPFDHGADAQYRLNGNLF